LLLSILAAVPAALMPLVAASQAVPSERSASAAPSYKYEAFVGYGYTSLNQVTGSNNGLQGVDLSFTRDWGKYFGVTGQGGYYKYAITATNAGKPSVTMVLAGPSLHAPLTAKSSAFLHVLLGGAHTGGENAIPDVSFSWGLGLGVDYQVKNHFYVRAFGDTISSSFYANPYVTNASELGTSAHRRSNAHAAIGVVYKF
jgi:hypothetical protein